MSLRAKAKSARWQPTQGKEVGSLGPEPGSGISRILALESSCDESAAAILDSREGLLAHELFSQIELHRLYGGVVPELASRDHVRKLLPLVRAVLQKAGTS
ncbi:MAG: hypothetical protein JO042_02960, partial [Sinobacteraceae bacterium]|nr:hypothetical protein [Nevskiaceae bacterium]